ncbi:hypothetical protein ACM26V_16820 [Salipaludibacillus sp. HK11]|uniref:hypothetical protein n=1 Tax=Salipaludibacillus sp. HK11 TaxID=3394320 RepID=UPI0039FC8371
MQDTVKINFNDEEFEVKKISIRQIPALANTLNDLPTVFKDVFMTSDGEAQDLDTAKMIELAPSLIFQAGETLPPFLAVATKIDLEKIYDGGIDDLILLIQAVLQVNNFETIVGYLKNFKMSTQKK